MLDKHQHHHASHDFDGIRDNREGRIPWYFSALFYGLILWAIVFMGYYLLSGWSSEGEFAREMNAFQEAHQAAREAPEVADATTTDAEAVARGEKLFAKRCAMCHGKTGKGGVGPDLTAAEYHYSRDPDAVVQTITGGRPGGMPAFGNELSPADVDALARFVLSLE